MTIGADEMAAALTNPDDLQGTPSGKGSTPNFGRRNTGHAAAFFKHGPVSAQKSGPDNSSPLSRTLQPTGRTRDEGANIRDE